MNQKEALAHGLVFGSANAQKVLKRIREHVVWGDLRLEDRRQFDEALLLLDPLGRKYEARWQEECRRRDAEWRAENERRRASRDAAA